VIRRGYVWYADQLQVLVKWRRRQVEQPKRGFVTLSTQRPLRAKRLAAKRRSPRLPSPSLADT